MGCLGSTMQDERDIIARQKQIYLISFISMWARFSDMYLVFLNI